MDEDIIEFYSTKRENYEETLDKELEKRKFEVENKRMLYYIIRELKNLYPRGIDNILDVGGSIGATLYTISQYLKINNAYSIDLYLPPIEIQNKLPNIKFLKSSAYELTKLFKEEYFDVVLLIDVIEHLFDTDKAVEEIRKVLKNNGILVISTPNLSSFINRLLLFFGYQPLGTEVSTIKHYGRPRKYNLREGVAGHIRVFTYKALNEFLEDKGFSIIKSYTVINNWPKEYNILHRFESFLIKINKSFGSRILVIARKK
ncbi:SAM-dependent methyltransferase [Nanoarchaeota archaeon]